MPLTGKRKKPSLFDLEKRIALLEAAVYRDWAPLNFEGLAKLVRGYEPAELKETVETLQAKGY